jgi:hypothetical protein
MYLMKYFIISPNFSLSVLQYLELFCSWCFSYAMLRKGNTFSLRE